MRGTQREDLEISKNSDNKVCSLSENLSIRIFRIYALFEYVLLLIKHLDENFFFFFEENQEGFPRT